MSLQNSVAEKVNQQLAQGDILGLVSTVCVQERKSAEVDGITMTWDSRRFRHFTTPLALEGVVFQGDLSQKDIRVAKAGFHLFGEDESELVVNESNQPFIRTDPFSIDIISAFVRAYTMHPHLACLSLLRTERQQQLETERLAREARKGIPTRNFKVTINGIVQPSG